MRLEGLSVRDDGGLTRRTADLIWIGGETQLTVEVPSEYAPRADDYSPFVPVALLSAMRRAEPLQIDGPVSALQFGNLTLAQEIVSAWNPTLRRIPVRAAAVEEAPAARTSQRACCYSRGIDSTYSAAVPRAAGEKIDCLVHWRDFELLYSEATQEREVELVRDAARRLDLPVVVVSSDVPRAIVDLLDFDDATSAMLASVVLSLPGLAGRFAIPSTCGYADIVPLGTHPLLDGLWSTEAVAMEHDSCVATRDGKVEWLVRNRPDLLDTLHICLEQDSTENCGRCGKCLWTMLLLHLNGALAESSFPDRIDPVRLRRELRPALHHLKVMERVHERLAERPEDAELARAARHAIRASTRRPMPRQSLSIIAQHQRRLHLLMHGRVPDVPTTPTGVASAEVGGLDPAWPPPRDQPAGVVGLIRAVDHDARRHRYAVGRLPGGQRSGELGALLAERPADGVPLELSPDGQPLLDLPAEAPSAMRVVRWVAGPLVWRGVGDAGGARPLGHAEGPRRRAPPEAGPEACAGPARRMATPERWKRPARAARRGASGTRRHPPHDGPGRGA